MLLTTVNENDPIYQLCEEAVGKYIETLDESYLISFCEDKDDDDMDILYKHKGNMSLGMDQYSQIKDDAKNISSNPFKVRKFIMDMPGDMESRARAIGVHQPQKKKLAAMAFWAHPTTEKVMKWSMPAAAALTAATGLKKIYDYENKPVGVIAKKIASLRKVLAKLKKKINGGGILPKEKNVLQKVATKVTEAIDKLLKFAQKASSNFSREFARK